MNIVAFTEAREGELVRQSSNTAASDATRPDRQRGARIATALTTAIPSCLGTQAPLSDA